METFIKNILTIQTVINVLDVSVITFVIYSLLKYVRGTRVMTIVRGVLLLIVVRLVAGWIGLATVSWLLDQVINWGPIALVVVFQPEIRRALENIGRQSYLSTNNNGAEDESKEKKFVLAIGDALKHLSDEKIGALIAIEQKTPLDDLANTGIPINAEITSALLINTFIPNTPLHDGAVIIKNLKLEAAAVVLPLSMNRSISKALGTRHRSAIGLSEVSDAIVIVASEETGEISIAYNGYLMRALDQEEYMSFLTRQFVHDEEENTTVWGNIRRYAKKIVPTNPRKNKKNKGKK